MPHVFVTSCVDADHGEDINEMVDSPSRVDISSKYFIEKLAPRLGIDKQILEMLNYDTKAFFASDFALRCARSFYQGIPCVYVQHSRIEHIFVDAKDIRNILDKEGSRHRIHRISVLAEDLDDVLHELRPKSSREFYVAVTDFHAKNKSVLTELRIPVSSLILHRHDYADQLAIFDKRNYNKPRDEMSPSL